MTSPCQLGTAAVGWQLLHEPGKGRASSPGMSSLVILWPARPQGAPGFARGQRAQEGVLGQVLVAYVSPVLALVAWISSGPWHCTWPRCPGERAGARGHLEAGRSPQGGRWAEPRRARWCWGSGLGGKSRVQSLGHGQGLPGANSLAGLCPPGALELAASKPLSRWGVQGFPGAGTLPDTARGPNPSVPWGSLGVLSTEAGHRSLGEGTVLPPCVGTSVLPARAGLGGPCRLLGLHLSGPRLPRGRGRG